jgi:hypothetical protein
MRSPATLPRALRVAARLAFSLSSWLALDGGCTPDVPTDPLPEVLEFDPSASPPRASEPTFLLRNPVTGKIDLGLAGIDVAADCATVPPLSRAQCEFDQYLESLDGFPTVAGARTPASAVIDLATATVPANVAVIEASRMQPVTDVLVGFDATGGYLQIAPKTPWPVGGFIWMGVRGYDNGVHAAGKPVVASVPYNLLKRDESLTCGAATADAIDESCPYFQLVVGRASDERAQIAAKSTAKRSLADLEKIRQAMVALGGWPLLATVGGIPKSEAAVLWGFPIHSASVVDLNPAMGLEPKIVGPNEIRLAVNGTVDPATVSAFRLAVAPGTVVFMNLSALAEMDLVAGLPKVTATYEAGAIVIHTELPLDRSNTYGVAIRRGVKNTQGTPLVPPPVSVLLMARGTLLDAEMKSTVSSVSDADAKQLEVGRQQLATLLDNDLFVPLTAIAREDLAYLFAFSANTPP